MMTYSKGMCIWTNKFLVKIGCNSKGTFEDIHKSNTLCTFGESRYFFEIRILKREYIK